MIEKAIVMSLSIGKAKRIMARESMEGTDLEMDYLQDAGEERQLCDNCKNIDYYKVTLAERYCIKCEEKLCGSCSQEHENTEEHLVVTLNEQKKAKIFKESNECVLHYGKLAELYCACCRIVICDECEKKSHSSHNSSRVEDVADSVSKQAEEEYENLLDIQSHFDEERKKLFNEQVKLVKTIKEMEMDIRRRSDEITEFVCNETKALLAELDAFRKERQEEIDMERRRMEQHAFAFKKFKEYCDQIKSNAVPRYTCEAEGVLRNVADDLKNRPGGCWKGRLFSIQFSIYKTDMEQIFSSLSDAVGKLIIECPYKMTRSGALRLNLAEVYDMARLHDKLYLLSNSISIRRLQHPFASIGKIKIPEIKSPKYIISCSKKSCLYIYDEEADSVWKVSIPDHRVSLWLDKIKEPGTLSVTSNAELLMLRNSKPVCLEVYNEHAILVRRLKLPASIPSLSSIYETPSGKYFGLGEQGVFALRRDGSIISQFETSEHEECRGNLRRFDISPYHIFLHCFPSSSNPSPSSSSSSSPSPSPSASPFSFGSYNLNCDAISSLTFDLTSHQCLIKSTKGLMPPITSCYLKKTKQLLVLDGASTSSRILKTYNVFPA